MSHQCPLAPRLEVYTRKGIADFLSSYSQYVRDVEEYNSGKNKAHQVKAKSPTSCINSRLWDLISKGEEVLDGGNDPNKALIEFLTTSVENTTFNEARADLVTAFKDLRLNLDIEDPVMRVYTFDTDLQEILSVHGFPDDVGLDKVKFGKIVKVLLSMDNCIRPPGIVGWLLNDLDGDLDGKITDCEFRSKLVKLVKVYDMTYRGNLLARMYNVSGRKSKRDESSAKPNTKQVKRPKNRTDRRSPTCFGCQGNHKLDSCPVVTNPEQRQKLIDNWRSSRNTSRGSHYTDPTVHYSSEMEVDPRMFGDTSSPTGTPVSVESRPHPRMSKYYRLRKLNTIDGTDIDWEETFPTFFDDEKIVAAGAILDSGTDRTVVSNDLLQQILRVKHVDVTVLSQPLRLELADGKSSIQATKVAVLDLHFAFKTGAIVLRRKECLVVEEALQYPLIGRLELQSLGIDPKTNLERLLASTAAEDIETTEREEDFNNYYVEVGNSSDKELRKVLTERINAAKSSGLPKEYWNDLQSLVFQYIDIFRINLEKDPPADVPPMDVHLKPDFKFSTPQNRRYSQEELAFLKDHINTLLEKGYIKRNPNARWSSPVLISPKPNNGGYRMLVDVKFPNAQVQDVHWPMPFLDDILRQTTGSRCYAMLDAFKGYWQFPVTDICGEVYSFITPFGTFTSNRIIQGASNSVKYFQSGMEEALELHKYDDTILWVDDILSHAGGPKKLLQTLARVFQRCRVKRIKLSATKCCFFQTSITWCGRNISPDGIAYDPDYIQGIMDMPEPETVADLQQFLCAVQWMSSAIPHHSQATSYMRGRLQEMIKVIGSCKKRRLKRHRLSLFPTLWGPKEYEQFLRIKSLAARSIRHAHIDMNKELCIFPDASYTHWGLFVSQIPKEDVNKPFEKQHHEPLVCMSGSFKKSQKKWHIKEKEAYPIVLALKKLRHMLRRSNGFRLFTDHRNLVYIFDPNARQSIAKNADDRVSRWSLLLMGFKYHIEHITGEDNVIADLLSRWGSPETTISVNRLRFKPGQVNILQNKDFQWPSLTEIARLQESHLKFAPPKTKLIDRLIQLGTRTTTLKCTENGRIWVPNEDLRVRLCVIAHAGLAGHRGIKQTSEILAKHFYWTRLTKDVERFCRQCLHCRTDGPDIIPRPLGSALHGTKPNQILHYDFMHIGGSEQYTGNQVAYVLVIKDDFSGYVQLFPCKYADSTSAVNGLLAWYSNFGIPDTHVTDGGSHFKNEVIKELNRLTQTKHHFTHAYVPRANGTVEIVNRQLRKLIRIWNSEFQLTIMEWPKLIPLLQYVVNFSKSSIHGHTPGHVFGGFKSPHPLEVMFHSKEKVFVKSRLTPEEIRESAADLIVALNNLHKRINDKAVSRRGKHSAPKKKRLPKKANFHVGDFVMYATRYKGAQKRSRPKWTGPYRVTRVVSEWDYEIEHLVNGQKSNAHSTRLDFYADASMDVDAELRSQISHDESQMKYKVERIMNHRKKGDIWELQVHWRGFDPDEATWEPLQTIAEDLPVMTQE